MITTRYSTLFLSHVNFIVSVIDHIKNKKIYFSSRSKQWRSFSSILHENQELIYQNMSETLLIYFCKKDAFLCHQCATYGDLKKNTSRVYIFHLGIMVQAIPIYKLFCLDTHPNYYKNYKVVLYNNELEWLGISYESIILIKKIIEEHNQSIVSYNMPILSTRLITI